MRFDHRKFFDGFKEKFDHSLEQDQVDGIEFLLTSFENDSHWTDVRHIAYALGTTFHETNGSMQPVEEGYYLEARHGKAGVVRFQKGLRYYPWFGRGYVQLTWNSVRIPNYTKANRELPKQMPKMVAAFEAETGQKFDLIAHPEQALDKHIAFGVMTLGMFQGWFTTKKLTDFIHGAVCKYVDARTIINGHDKAGVIAAYAERFERLLRSCLINSPIPAPVIVPEPEKDAEVEEATETATGGQETVPVKQEAGVIVNSGAEAPKSDTEVLAKAAQDLDDTKVGEKEKTGILGKASAFIMSIITGSIILPDWLTNGINVGDTIRLIGGGLYDFRYIIVGGLAIWFVVNKWESVALKTQVIQTNSDPTKGNVILVPHVSLFDRIRSLIGK